MAVISLDHLVLTVSDVSATCTFYTSVLEMEEVTFGGGRKALRFGDQKINLHAVGHEIAPHAQVPTRGSADLCFLTNATAAEILDRLRTNGVMPELGPVARTGANGPIMSIYLRDPDGNLIELACADGA
jgi:catechol 2,3-dioxygenase-like lactoylglutathione lyase family enzyme